MSMVPAAEIKGFVLSFLAEQLGSSGRSLNADPPDDFDLMKEGIVDSLGMFQLTAELENHFGSEIDYTGLDPEEMTILGPLCRYVERMLNEAKHEMP